MDDAMQDGDHHPEDKELRRLVETMIAELKGVPVPAAITALAHQLQTLIDKKDRDTAAQE